MRIITCVMCFCALLLALPLFAEPDRKAEALLLYKKALKSDDVRGIELLARAHQLDPRNASVVYRMGFLYHKMNRVPEAEKYYGLTLGIEKCNERAHNNLGSIYAARNETERAIESYRTALKCEPRSVSAAYNLANLLSEDGKKAEAENLYLKALSIDPRHARSHHNLGVLYMNRGGEENLKKADLHLSRARVINPADPLVLYNAALVKEHLNAPADALKLLDSADRLCENRASLRKKVREARTRLQTR